MAHHKRGRCRRHRLACTLCQHHRKLGNGADRQRDRRFSVIRRDPLTGRPGRRGRHRLDPTRWADD